MSARTILKHVYENGGMTEYQYERIDRVLKEQRPHGEWIPVKERLPEEDGKYIVCWCGEWGASICFAEYSKCGKYWYERNGSEYRGITAWMPLPKPYKRGDDV